MPWCACVLFSPRIGIFVVRRKRQLAAKLRPRKSRKFVVVVVVVSLAAANRYKFVCVVCSRFDGELSASGSWDFSNWISVELWTRRGKIVPSVATIFSYIFVHVFVFFCESLLRVSLLRVCVCVEGEREWERKCECVCNHPAGARAGLTVIVVIADTFKLRPCVCVCVCLSARLLRNCGV